MKKWIIILFVSLSAVLFIAFLLYKPVIENRLEIILQQQGLENVNVEIARLGIGGAVLNELSFGGDDPLKLNNIVLNYSLEDLQQGRLDEIQLENIVIKANQNETGWIISGLGALQSDSSNQNPLSFLNITAEQIEQIPFRKLGIQDSQILLGANFGSLEIPINAVWEKHKNPNLTYQSEAITFSQDDLEFKIENPDISASFDNGIWSGNWSVPNITNNSLFPVLTAQGALSLNSSAINATGDFKSVDDIYAGNFTLTYAPEINAAPIIESDIAINLPLQGGNLQLPLDFHWVVGEPMEIKGEDGTLRWEQGELSFNVNALKVDVTQDDTAYSGAWSSDKISVTAPIEVPLLKGSGDIKALGSALTVNGVVNSPDKSWSVDFVLTLGQEKPSANGLRIKSAKMPWNKGRVSVRDIWVPFDRQRDLKLDIKVEQVDLAELMSSLTGDRIRARGLVTGHVPITMKPDGSITVDGGNLGAEGPGTIVMPPETIPANNDQVNLVKDIMQDLQFEVLNISADHDENGNLIINLSVEGKNPKVLDGHPVKLNINLTGNLVEFIEQNLMLLTAPETLLKRKQD